MALNTIQTHQSNDSLRSPSDDLKLRLIHSTRDVRLYEESKINIIRYTWHNNDERLFFMSSQHQFLEDESVYSSFPSITQIIGEDLPHDKPGVNNQIQPNLLCLDIYRGPQSFAFGHFMVDILPVITYINIMKSMMYKGSTPAILIYSSPAWLLDLLCLFNFNASSVYTLDRLNPIRSLQARKGQLIRYYSIKSLLAQFNMQKLRAAFALWTPILPKAKELLLNRTLILSRESVGSRPLRWINQDDFLNRLKSSIKIDCECIDPGKLLPSKLASISASFPLIVSSPGSGAYIPLHCASETFIIMPIPHDAHHPEIWVYTLTMFAHYAHKLILISDMNALPPSSHGWDHPFRIRPEDLSQLVTELCIKLSNKTFTVSSLRRKSLKPKHFQSTLNSLKISAPISLSSILIESH